MMLLESPDGERVIVSSPEGYAGWAVLADPVEQPPPHCYWCPEQQGWRELEGAAERAKLLAKVRDPEQLADIIADIWSRLPSPPE